MFTITITETQIEEVISGKEWKLTGHEHSPGSGIAPELCDRKFAYTPEITKRKSVERKIYEQTVDDLDVTSVIKSILEHSNRKSMAVPHEMTQAEFGKITGMDRNA